MNKVIKCIDEKNSKLLKKLIKTENVTILSEFNRKLGNDEFDNKILPDIIFFIYKYLDKKVKYTDNIKIFEKMILNNDLDQLTEKTIRFIISLIKIKYEIKDERDSISMKLENTNKELKKLDRNKEFQIYNYIKSYIKGDLFNNYLKLDDKTIGENSNFKNTMINEMIKRMKLLINYLGKKYIESCGVKLIYELDFIEKNYDDKIKYYLNTIYKINDCTESLMAKYHEKQDTYSGIERRLKYILEVYY